ncbi:hypothetical protein AGOR_G00069140 [Albula goreensis]|uniref:CARD domain-containing protein n=1 Tax=Albula goreensis TaxID=1534307 RepID=A0A8T3DQ86_9TELE|nr:hypothetical protein AGOR_G00069140 [Albula goreensis]
MACTQQSALNYVTNGRVHLIGRLRNLPLIIEKLRQCGVLNENEVSVINSSSETFSKTRKILDMVTANGEEACYEFLRILDVTRKRTLPEQQQGFSASRVTRSCDLLQWIISFPFREDRNDYTAGSEPCHRYQRKLKAKDRTVQLDLENSVVTDLGWKLILSCVKKIKVLGLNPSMFSELWETALHCGQQCDFTNVLRLCGNEFHFPVKEQENRSVCVRAGDVMKQSPEKVKLCLHWDQHIYLPPENFTETIFQCLTNIATISFIPPKHQTDSSEEWERRVSSFSMDLCLQGALYETETGQNITGTLMSALSLNSAAQQSEFLLDLYSHVKDYETQTGRSFLSALQTLYQSAPAEWVIDLSKRKASLFLKVLKLQTVKKPVELLGWSDEESEVRIFLECLLYISQLSFIPPKYQTDPSKEWKGKLSSFILDLCLQGTLYETERNITRTLMSALSLDSAVQQSEFLLDLYSHVEDYETQTGRSVLSAFLPLYQSAPAEWAIDLSERKASLFLEVLKLQTVKKPVRLMGWSDEESEVRIFLECLLYISQLSSKCHWNYNFEKAAHCVLELWFQAVVHEAETGRRTVTLLSSVYSFENALDDEESETHSNALLDLYSRVEDYETRTGRRVLSALQTLYQSAPAEWAIDLSKRKASLFLKVLKLQTVKKPVKLTGWSDEENEVRELLECLPYISELRLHTQTLQQLAVKVCEAGEERLTQRFLQKVGGDLTGCTLDWNVLQYLLPRSTQHFTVDLRKSGIKEQNIRDLLHFLHRIQLKRLNSRFMMAALREIFEMGAGDLVFSLVKSAGNWINLNKRVLDSHDCAALRFTLSHTDRVGLSLIWASITEEEIQRTVPLLTRVSQLRMDRKLLLKLLHSCLTSEHQQGAAELLRTLQFKLDFSCSCSVDLTAEEESMSLCLSVSDCSTISTTISTAIQLAQCDTQLNTQLVLKDCTIEDAGLEELYPILHRVHLSLSKPLLLQLVCMTPVQDEGRSVSRATALLRALGGELDLSHTPLSLQACRSLALVLDRSDGLAELDLSHCQLTDHCVEPLLPHLHKTRVLDLSHNDITNHGGQKIHMVVSDCSFIESVRLFGNKISDRGIFQEDQRYEIW